jgi:hypothetical protein
VREAQDDFAHGFQNMRCDSVLALAADPASRSFMDFIVGWVEGWQYGVGVTLWLTTQEPGKTGLEEIVKDSSEVSLATLAAIFVSSYSGAPPTIDRVSPETHRSQLLDHCHLHPQEHFNDATGELLMKWLTLPKVAGK